MKISVKIFDKSLVHTRFYIYVDGALICNVTSGICLRNEEVNEFMKRLNPDKITDNIDDWNK